MKNKIIVSIAKNQKNITPQEAKEALMEVAKSVATMPVFNENELLPADDPIAKAFAKK